MGVETDRSSARSIAIAFALALTAASLVAHTLYVNRSNYGKTDFRYYWCWGVELASGGNPWLGTGARPPGVSRCRECNYPPPIVRVFALLTSLREKSGYWVWQGIEIGTFIAAMITLAREAIGSLDPAATVTIVALAFLFPPVVGTLHEGQVTLFLFCLTVAAWASSLRGHPVWAGFWLGLAIAIKLVPGILVGYFLVRLRIRELIWTAFFFALIVLSTGVSYWHDFFVHGIASTLVGERFRLLGNGQINLMAGVYSVANAVMNGAPGQSIWFLSATIAAILGIAVAGFAMYATHLAPERAEAQGLCLGIWMAGALMLVPRSWYHELAMVVPLYLFAGAALWNGTWRIDLRPARWSLVLLALSLVLIIGAAYTSAFSILHAGLLSTVTAFIGGCLLVGTGNGSTFSKLGPREE